MELVDEGGVEAWRSAPKVITTSYFAVVREHPEPRALPVSDAVAGTLMRFEGRRGMWVGVGLPLGRKGYIEQSHVEEYARWRQSRHLTPENVERTAKMFLGVPYVWGGTSPKGMDCSGYTKTVFRLNGMELLRDASQQVRMGEEVVAGDDFENLKKGDLLFFGRKATAERPERITHVAIFLEKKEFIHSPGGGYIRINSFDPNAPNYSESLLNSFVRARRVIGATTIPEVVRN
jgi:cell wall-associated NlpC family hydrolase